MLANFRFLFVKADGTYWHYCACRKVNTTWRIMKSVFRISYGLVCITEAQCTFIATQCQCWQQNNFLSLLKHKPKTLRHAWQALTFLACATLTSERFNTVTCAALHDHRAYYAHVCHPLWILSTPLVCRILHATRLLYQNLTVYKNRYLNIILYNKYCNIYSFFVVCVFYCFLILCVVCYFCDVCYSVLCVIVVLLSL